MALHFIEAELYNAGIVIFDHFAPEKTQNLMAVIYELGPYSLEIHWMCKYKLPTSRLSKVIVRQTCIHTDANIHDQNYIPRRFTGG